jgi:hypothetical protein
MLVQRQLARRGDDLLTGEPHHYQRDAIFTFLKPWLAILAQRVLGQYGAGFQC